MSEPDARETPEDAAHETVTPDDAKARLAADAGFQKRRPGATIHLHQDRGTSWMAWFFGLMIVVVVAGAFFGRFARTESVRGYVSAASGLSRLDAQSPGIVRAVDVKQGDTVKRGQRLIQIQVREPMTGGVSTVRANERGLLDRQAILRRDRERLTAYLNSTSGDQRDTESNVANVVKAYDEQEKNLNEGLRNAEEMVKRVDTYLKKGYATRESLNDQKRIALDYNRQISELRARRAELRQETAERLRAQRTNVTDKQSQLATTENELASIAAQLTGLSAQSTLDIVAPFDGQMAGVFVEPGASIAADQVLAIIGAEGAEPLIVLEVPARAIGLAKVGQDVVIKYDAFPFKTFGVNHGTITSIAGSPLHTPMVAMATAGDVVIDPNSAARQSTYRVAVNPKERTIRAYGIDEPIRIGSTLTADIVVEKRRLIDWMLDPIRAMRGRG